MEIEDAEARFRQVHQDAGGEADDFMAWWRAFTRFATEPVESASDGLLFQAGTYSFTGSEKYTVGFVRQFEVVDEDNEFEYYVQLQCEFLYEPNADLRALGSYNLWCFPSDGDSIDDWVGAVEARIEFQTAQRLAPTSVTVEQEQV